MLPAELRIRDICIRPATILAPMAGITDTVFRRVIRGLGGCGLIMTEFTSAECVVRDTRRSQRYLFFEPDEHPITGQLFGANPDSMAAAARLVEEQGFDAVDINLGCPAKKVVKCGGSGLLRDLPLLETILKSVRAAVRIPLTVKIRAGWDPQSIVAAEVARMAQDCGVEAIAVHPRTRLQGFDGSADWNIIRAVRQAVTIPVIGNGDVRAPEDAARMVAETGCHAVMIGRAAASNPWIFRQMESHAAGRPCAAPTETERHELLLDYFRRLVEAGTPDALGKMKQFACWFTHGVRNGSILRREVHTARSTDEVFDRVEAFFSRPVSA